MDMNSGYSGYSMSIRARQAYMDGEKPLSKWTKVEILETIEEYKNKNKLVFDMNLIKKLKVTELKRIFLSNTSWHHTSSYCNRTDFYSISEEMIDCLTNEKISEYIEKANKKKILKEESNIFKCDFEYLEWTGTRNHPKAKKISLENVNIEEKGCFYIVTDDQGNQIVKKKIDSKGTFVHKKGV